jgi:aconitate hydratase
MPREPQPVPDIEGARCLVILGDSVTTDHISPAGSIKPDSPAGKYLLEHGVERREFNSYGSRRGNHEVLVRGTFANVRLRNLLVPGSEGSWTAHLPDGEEMTIFDAAELYLADGVPLIVLAGKEYGSGSSRDWAAKGPKLLGVRAVIAESYERIHRSNLVGMGVVPLQFKAEGWVKLGLTGEEIVTIRGLTDINVGRLRPRQDLWVELFRPSDGKMARFPVRCRIDNQTELDYLLAGGVMPYVLRNLARGPETEAPIVAE